MGNHTTDNGQTQAANFTMLHRAIWRDPDWKRLSYPSQWAYLMLISQRDLSPCGILQMNERRWLNLAEGLDRDIIDLAMRELSETRFIVCDYETGELWVRSFMKYDRRMHVTSKNGRTYVAKAVQRIESDELRGSVDAEMRRVGREINAAIEAKKAAKQAKEARKAAREATAKTSNSATSLPTSLGSTKTALQNCITEEQQQQPQAPVPQGELPKVAAAALELFIEHRALDSNPRALLPWKQRVRTTTIEQQGAQMLAALEKNPEATPNDICRDVFRMGPIDLFDALEALEAQGVKLPVEVTP